MSVETTSYGRVIGIGSYLPKNKLTNDDMAKIVETSDEWITERTGIKERHISDPETDTSESMAVEAAKKAVADAGIDPLEIGLIVVASTTPNVLFPVLSASVQAAVNADNAMCFDMNAACPGFVTAFVTAQNYIKAGAVDCALVIGTENLTNYVNFEDRGTCILFGDGAGAVVLKAEKETSYDVIMRAAGKRGECMHCESYMQKGKEKTEEFLKSNYINMDGQTVFKFAVTEVPRVIEDLLKKTGTSADEIDYFILHQANRRIIESVAKRLKQPIEKFPMNIERTANTSSASIPILLDEMKKDGRIGEGKKHVIMSSFGAGLLWGAFETYI
ncbi:MAG: ketoacyl-ACP synthase III [Clostridiales bacterium]|jgi:3-oxoacyl-[acyl-carrier-protein] synthase-3|nr:ketoacyl-ACP synthase III [Clostridiales bacterium]